MADNYTKVDQVWECIVNAVNVRHEPSMSGHKIAGLYKGEKVTVSKIDSSGMWHFIPSKGGWFRHKHTDGVTIMKLVSEKQVPKETKPDNKPKTTTQPETKDITKSAIAEDTNIKPKSAGTSAGVIKVNQENYKNYRTTGAFESSKNIDNTNEPIPYAGRAYMAVDTLRKLDEVISIVQNQTEEQRFYKFDRAGIMDPVNRIISTKEYVFFTKTDLHILMD